MHKGEPQNNEDLGVSKTGKGEDNTSPNVHCILLYSSQPPSKIPNALLGSLILFLSKFATNISVDCLL